MACRRLTAGAWVLAAVMAGGAIQVAQATAITVSDVAGLTNAIARGYSPIILNPGVYDLSTLEPFVVSNGNAFAWGTNYAPDTAGPAHLVFRNKTDFQGANTKHWSQKTRAEESIIRGAGSADTMRLIYGYTGGGRSSTYSHLTFESGNANGYNGGAIFINGSTLTPNMSISNCVFRNNSASVGGAVAYMSVCDSLFETNTAQKGGAMYLEMQQNGSVMYTNNITHCVFRGNTGSNSGGGAICSGYNGSCPVFGSIRDCVFLDNVASSLSDVAAGGAIRLSATTVPQEVIRDCTFIGNKAPHGKGGAIYSGNVNGFSNCTFRCNQAMSGGAAYVDGTMGKIEICVVVSNSCTSDCGAFYLKKFTDVAKTTFAFNTAPASCAGLYAPSFANSGSVEDCVFESNTNGPACNTGSQICNVQGVTRCTFRGYGDMFVRNYDRCVFEGCSFDYESYGGGMIRFDTTSGSGYLRNCLFTNNNVHTYIYNASGQAMEIANCTFASNNAKRTVNLQSKAMSNGYLIYAFRGGSDPNTGKAYPSTNYVINCIFANNTRDSASGVKQADISSYGTLTSVAQPADCIYSNCLYQTSYSEGVSFHSNAAVIAPPKFVDGDSRYPGVPACMPRHSSMARKAGLVLPWMADATDLVGAPMVSAEGTVDLGCYQCTLPPVGVLLFLR